MRLAGEQPNVGIAENTTLKAEVARLKAKLKKQPVSQIRRV